MANQYVNKVVFGGRTILDISADTASESTVLQGQTFHDRTGAPKVGSCTFDADTSDATASVAEILKGETAYVNGAKITGTMPNNGAKHIEMQTTAPVTIPQGYHDGSGSVAINADDLAKLIPKNLRQGVEILDVIGTMSTTEGVNARQAEATPKTTEQLIVPGEGYNYLTSCKIKAIPYVETDNPAGGKTATIA